MEINYNKTVEIKMAQCCGELLMMQPETYVVIKTKIKSRWYDERTVLVKRSDGEKIKRFVRCMYCFKQHFVNETVEGCIVIKTMPLSYCF